MAAADPQPDDPSMTNHTVTAPEAIVQPLADAVVQAVLGGSISVRVRAEDTAGQFGLIEQVVPGGFPGPAMHVHPEFDETFYVLEGTLAFRVEDQAYDAPAGTVAFIPRGTRHTFANTSARPVRSLVLLAPGGFERYFDELIALIARRGGLPPEEELRDLGVTHGSVPA
jgi:mannose-6-phosphate isomerase-like protein (cupin superfamily)